MNESTPFEVEHEDRDEGFSQPIHRAVLRDRRLSLEARGLFALVWDFPKSFVINKRQLINMADGIRPSRIDSVFKELTRIGAFVFKARRLTKEHAEVLSEQNNGERTYKAGQLAGQVWLVRHPKNWAIEHDLKGNPLKPLPNGASTVCQKNRPTVKTVVREKPCDGFFTPHKVHQVSKGSPSFSKQQPHSRQQPCEQHTLAAAAEKQVPIIMENSEDAQRYQQLAEQFGEEAVLQAAKETTAGGRRPYLSNIRKQLLHKLSKTESRYAQTITTPAQQQHDHHSLFDPETLAIQRATLEELLGDDSAIDGHAERC